jgi:hypothetical protein
VKEVELLDVDGNVNIMGFKLRNKNIPESFKAYHSSRTPLRFTEEKKGDDWTYIDENTRQKELSVNGVLDKDIWESNKDGVRDKYASFDEYQRAAEEWRQKNIIREKRDVNTVHWSADPKVLKIYRDYGELDEAGLNVGMRRFLRKKANEYFRNNRDQFINSQNPDGIYDFKRFSSGMSDDFANAQSMEEFIEIAQKEYPYLLESGSGPNTQNKKKVGNWKRQ